MVKNMTNLSSTIDSVHETMKIAKTRLKNAAALGNLTDLRPILHSETRWSRNYAM